jgi:hypothetical protein
VKLKNLGRSARNELAGGGHEVAAVPEQSLSSAADDALIEACRAEGRALVTLNLDFANPAAISARALSGIAVFRPPPRISAAILLALVKTLAGALEKEQLADHLWTIDAGRIRVHEGSDGG